MKHKEKQKHLERRHLDRTEEKSSGPCNTQEDAPQHESPVEAPACVQEAGGDPSPSEYFTCVSSASKLPHSDVNDLHRAEYSENPCTRPLTPPRSKCHVYLNSYSPYTHILLFLLQGTDLRLTTIYYTRVQLKRGVAVLCHTQERLEPPSKNIKMEEMTYIEKIHENVPMTHMSENKSLIDHEHNLESRAQEKREEADLDGYPSAKTPEWLVALDSGFRCMACCRVFPSLEVLQEHVEYGVREGFSCHAFHNAMAHLRYKDLKEDEQENQGGN
uniref:Family with sequence similarity 170 member A n=1 Tax=Myotis lucifugus TaxID=59463 RepID=G1Q2P6_MYOLU